MVKIGKYSVLIILTLIGLGFAIADAQENLAQEAYAILQQNCLICHGEHGAHTEQLVIQISQALINTGTVIPGNPDDSEFYQRLIETAVERRMPLGQPPLAPEAIETIRQWIQAGAPDWNAFPISDTNFITPDEMLEAIENHLQSLDTFDRSFARYFTSIHLYNAGETIETLRAYQRALSKLVNSLSWGIDVINPEPIDPQGTIFYIDLRDYEWEIGTDRWTQIEQEYPYKNNFESPTQTHLHEKLMNLRQEMNCEVPFVHIDWFLANASLPPLYHDILDLPLTDRDLETRLEVNVVENIRNAAGRRVWRAGFNNSGVSNNNRVVERHRSRYGAYWKSYDFAGSVGNQNIFTHPLSFAHDGGEIVFNLPNGLQAYYLADAGGNRLDEAPIDIVSNPAASDPTVRNGLSCIGCHTKGMKTFEDEVRAVIEQNANPPFDKAQALRLYVDITEMEALVEEDTDRYRLALEEAGGVFGGIEPIQRFHEAFQGPVDTAHAAAAVGLEAEVFLEKIRGNASLENLGLLVLENSTVKRDTWTSKFSEVVFALDFPEESVTTPVVPQTERIPGESVYIPDTNLRAAIAEALGKASSDVITAEDMARLIHLDARNWKDDKPQPQREYISNLTGLEFAINLSFLHIHSNSVSDLSPLAGLTKLDFLDAQGNLISDLSPLKGLTHLTGLILTGNLISDLSPLIGLTNLEALRVNENFISDFSPITKLTTLKEVWVSGESVSDLSLLAELINLEGVHAWDTSIEDISPLAELTKLRWLDFGRAPISNLSPLVGLTSLIRLKFYDCGIEDISALEGLTELIKIEMPHNTISDLSPLAGATHLTFLELDHNAISDVSSLAELTNLESLWIGNNEISDVSPLARLTNLKELNLNQNPITDFLPLDELFENTNIFFDVAIPDPNLRAAIAEVLGKGDVSVVPITLEEMSTLTSLGAQNKGISDLTGLEYAINLDNLYAPDNQITDLSPLSKLIKLRILNIYNNPIESLSPIADLSNLEYITIIGDEISDISPLAGLVKLRHFLTWGNPISDLTPLAGLTQLETLDICGADTPDISVLVKLTGLKTLYLASNGISDVSPLSGLKSLTHLNLEWNKISDVSPLASLSQLKWLGLHHNSISDFSPLAALSETTVISRAFNPGVPTGGPKIEGPWLYDLC